MTSENRTLLELADIAGVEFECRKCGAKVLYPMEKQYDRLADTCPNCSEPWFADNPNRNPAEPSISERVKRTLSSLRAIGASAEIRAQVRLYVKT